jgi:hypothetical protein
VQWVLVGQHAGNFHMERRRFVSADLHVAAVGMRIIGLAEERVSNPWGIAPSCWPPMTNATASSNPASSKLSWPPHPKTRLANASGRMV